jgi:NADPH-dependent ferric siderophore reductase
VPGYVLAGDESALPAISMLLDAIPHPVPVQVLVELAAPDGHVTLPGDAATAWLDQADWRPGGALVEALTEVDVPEGHHVWVAGEAASMHRIRQHLFDERGLARSRATVRGYWKHGRASPG